MKDNQNKNLYKNKFLVPTTRLSGWDYSNPGYYSVTICVHERAHYFGEISNSQMNLSNIGKIAENYWNQIPKHYPFVCIDSHIIMPNHIHGIIVINPHAVETHNCASLHIKDAFVNTFGPQSQNLPSIIRGFKSSVKRECNSLKLPFFWQPRYYEHIIRNEKQYIRIKHYIENNIADWEIDCENV